MALQHFYSRVPFRISMFNKADSFDTFAMTDGLDRNFIEKELFAVCERKPSARELDRIREDKLPPVYYSYTAKSGELIQSCQSYIPLDYTGERSAYLVHSLIMDDNEKNYVLCNQDNAIINKDMFEKDIDKFDITAKTEPNPNYEEKQIVAIEADSTKEFAEKYDETLIKNFIFSMIDTVCGKTKCVYFSVPDEENVDEVLYFFNTVMQVIPYHIRQGIAFASGVSDVNVLPSFNVKGVRDIDEDIQGSKGVYIRFGVNVVTGLKEDKYKANIRVTDFFYELMQRDDVRREFLAFAENAVKRVPSLGTLNHKSLHDIVYMFCCGCNYYEEKTVLPNDDTVVDFFAIYAKSRDAMNDDYRMNALSCLKRYPKNHLEIPKKVFSEISKLYPTECVGGKRIISNVILELIHTDIMRSKLFTFIKNNYDKESNEAKDVITENLSRVFYGGFLQTQILSMFEEKFKYMSDTSKGYLIDKFLLSLRTKNVQNDIISFFEKNYSYLTYDNKKEIYSDIAEHFSEGDELAQKLLEFADAHAEDEPDDNKMEFASDLFSVIESEQRKHAHPLLTMICEKNGFTGRTLEHKILMSWYYRKIFEEFVNLSCKASFADFIGNTVFLFYQMDNVEEIALNKLRVYIENALEDKESKCDIKELCLAYGNIAQMKKSRMQPKLRKFLEDLQSEVISKHMNESLCKVFKDVKSENAVENLLELVENSDETKASEQYSVLTSYVEMKDSAKANDKATLIDKISYIAESPYLKGENAFKDARKYLGLYLSREIARLGSEIQEPCRSFLEIVGTYLQNKTVEFSSYYDRFEEELSQNEQLEEGKKGKKESKANETISIFALELGYMLYSCKIDGLKNVLKSENSDYYDILLRISDNGSKQGLNGIKSLISKSNINDDKFFELCKAEIDKNRPKKKGFFAKLFSK